MPLCGFVAAMIRQRSKKKKKLIYVFIHHPPLRHTLRLFDFALSIDSTHPPSFPNRQLLRPRHTLFARSNRKKRARVAHNTHSVTQSVVRRSKRPLRPAAAACRLPVSTNAARVHCAPSCSSGFQECARLLLLQQQQQKQQQQQQQKWQRRALRCCPNERPCPRRRRLQQTGALRGRVESRANRVNLAFPPLPPAHASIPDAPPRLPPPPSL